MEPVVRAQDPLSSEWVTMIFLLGLVMLTTILRSAPRKWHSLMRAGFRKRMARQEMQEEMDLRDRNYLGLVLLGIGVLAGFIWQSLHILGVNGPSYVVLIGLVTAVLIAQGIVARLLAFFARTDAGTSEYARTGALIFTLLGLFMLPLAVLIAYRIEWRWHLMVVGMAMGAVALLYRWLRGAWIGMGEGVPLRYIILYFCAAEAMPLLLAVHALRPLLPTTSHL